MRRPGGLPLVRIELELEHPPGYCGKVLKSEVSGEWTKLLDAHDVHED